MRGQDVADRAPDFFKAFRGDLGDSGLVIMLSHYYAGLINGNFTKISKHRSIQFTRVNRILYRKTSCLRFKKHLGKQREFVDIPLFLKSEPQITRNYGVFWCHASLNICAVLVLS